MTTTVGRPARRRLRTSRRSCAGARPTRPGARRDAHRKDRRYRRAHRRHPRPPLPRYDALRAQRAGQRHVPPKGTQTQAVAVRLARPRCARQKYSGVLRWKLTATSTCAIAYAWPGTTTNTTGPKRFCPRQMLSISPTNTPGSS